MRREIWPYLMAAPVLLVLLGFEALPGLQVLTASFRTGEGHWTLAHYADVLTRKIWLAALANSLRLTLLSTLGGLALSVLGAFALSRSAGRTRRWVTGLVSTCVNFSGVPLTFAFMILLGSSGVVAALFKVAGSDLTQHFQLYGPDGLILVYLYFQIPLGTLLVLPAFAGLRQEWEEAAENLGARPWQFWRHVGLPLLAPAVGATGAILFANALGAQATAYALTNGMMNIMTVRMGRLVSGDVEYDPNLASAAAVVLALMMALALLANRWLTRRYRRWVREEVAE